MTTALVIPPNQLFDPHPGLAEHPKRVVLFQDPLFFADAQYPARFHAQKLWLHRASMARYERHLIAQGHSVETFAYRQAKDASDQLFTLLTNAGFARVVMTDPTDFIVDKRLRAAADKTGLTLAYLDNPGFLNTRAENEAWAKGRKRWFMAEFYKSQRTRLTMALSEKYLDSTELC